MIKESQNIYPIHELSRKRWSPRAFTRKPVEQEKLQSIFEAARWSASAGNEQPWRFIIGMHPDTPWQRIFETLDEGNQVWVKNAPVLLLAIGKKTRGKRNAENGYFAYDTGQAVAHLSHEATNLGLYLHQMAGFDPEAARIAFDISADYQPLTAICLGYLGDPENLPEDQKQSELSPRTRKPFDEFVFSGTFGNKSELF
jgi:nitroreductase